MRAWHARAAEATDHNVTVVRVRSGEQADAVASLLREVGGECEPYQRRIAESLY